MNIPIKPTVAGENAFGFISALGEKQTRCQDVQNGRGIGMGHFEVEATTIDEVVAAQAQRADFIRMDIKGSEKPALEGGWKTIEKFKPHLLVDIRPELLEK